MSNNRLLMMTRKNSGDTPAQHMMPFWKAERRRRRSYLRNTHGGGMVMTASAAAGMAAAPPPYPAPVSSMGFDKPDNCPSRSEHSIQGNFDIVLGKTTLIKTTPSQKYST